MLRFVEKPNLPQGNVRVILAGETYLSALNLQKYGITALPIPENKDLDEPVNAHTDLQAAHLYRNRILSSCDNICKAVSLYILKHRKTSRKVLELVEEIVWLNGSTKLESAYPKCAAYDALLFDNSAVFNEKCIDSMLKSEIEDLRFHQIPVRQGFARCSVCIVSAHAVITADRGIAAALRVQSVDVLEIRPGYIELPGYDYGFLGGASFLIAPDQLAFTGELANHPDYDRILEFLAAHDVRPVYLSDQPIFDMGSAIPIIEEVPVGECVDQQKSER